MAFIFSRCVSFCCYFVWQMIFRSLHVKYSVYLIIYCIHCHLAHCIWAKYHDCMSHSLKLSVKNQEQMFCTGNNLFQFVPTNKTAVHTRQWVKFCIYLLYNYCSVNSAKTTRWIVLMWLHYTHNTEYKHSLTRGCWKPRSNLLSASPLQLLFIELLRQQCLWLPAGDGWHSARHQWLQVWEWD